MSSDSVLVSVIMPLRNAEQFVEIALNSILQEQSIPLEIVVVNDNSTDNSVQKVDAIQDDRVRMIHNPGKGIASALNAGLAVAHGQIIMRCDADDLYPPNRLTKQAYWLMQNPEFGAVCGGYATIDAKGRPVITFDCGVEAKDITPELQEGVTRTHFCTYAVRGEVIRELGGFRAYFTTAEDIDLQLRLVDLCNIWYNPGVHYYYRLHNSSITHSISPSEREFFDQIARTFQLQRQAGDQDDLQRGIFPTPPLSCDKSPLSAEQQIQGLLLGQAWRELQDGNRRVAIFLGLRSATMAPRNLAVWRSLMILLVRDLLLVLSFFQAPFNSKHPGKMP